MNILKTLRKPYFAMFLASLILFVSCNQDSLLENSEIQTQTLEEYIAKHIELTSKLVVLKNSVDYDVVDKLELLQNKSIETSNLKITLENESIYISDEIFELQQRLIENTRILHNNPEYNSLNEEDFTNLIKDAISSQFNYNRIFAKNARASDPCLDAFNSANGDCLLEFTLSAGTVGVVGLFTTFGVGTLIGGAVALIRFGECNKSAQADLADCRGNQ